MGTVPAWVWIVLLFICIGAVQYLTEASKEVRKNRIILMAVGLLLASIIYSPHHIYYVEEAPVLLQPTVTRTQIDRVEYALIWAAPDHSSLEFGRLAVTWMGIVALGAAALYVNQNCNMDLDAMNRGNVARERGDFDSAISEYSEAIRVNSKNVLAYHNRGVAYAQKGDPDQAIANYNEAIRLKWPSKDAVMYQNRGNAYATKGDLDKANADFAKAKKLGYKP